MVNKPLIRPYFLGGVALGGAARIPMKVVELHGCTFTFYWVKHSFSLVRTDFGAFFMAGQPTPPPKLPL